MDGNIIMDSTIAVSMDGNINMDSTIAVSMNVHTRVVNFLLTMKVEFVWLKTYFFS
jgi:hypothetical protein